MQEIEKCVAMGQSVALIALGRYGKTSILLGIIRRAQQRKLFSFYLDVFSVQDIHSLAVGITIRCSFQPENQFQYSPVEKQGGGFDANCSISLVIGRKRIYSWIWSECWWLMGFVEIFFETDGNLFSKHDPQTLAVFDEFGDIGKLNGEDIVKLFRSELLFQKSVVCLF